MASNLPWFAVQLRSNREEDVRFSLTSKGYDVFLPTYNKRSCSNRKSRAAQVPLYPGYLFCRLNLAATGKIVTTPGVIRIVGFGGSPQAVPPDEMDTVMKMANSELLMRPWAYLPTGAPVRIESGPLQGLAGTLISNDRIRRLVVTVFFLQRSTAITLDDETELTCLSRPPLTETPLMRAVGAS